MKELHYEEWANNRYQKIISILGRNWFRGKKVLELACSHGEIGKKLLKSGADVYFSDVNPSFLHEIGCEINSYGQDAKVIQMDQNQPYSFDFKYDLILHFGVLYHLENWKQDLRCAMEHTDLMFLETLVDPNSEFRDDVIDYKSHNAYDSTTGKLPIFTQKVVEKELEGMGCKYLCIKSQDLDTQWTSRSSEGDEYIRHLYSWDENVNHSIDGTHYRRFWIVMK